MKRREFIQCAIGAALAALPWHQASVEEGYVRLLPAAKGDLAGEESESGFAQAIERLSQAHPRTSRTVIVPSASALEGTGFLSLAGAARRGATVLIDLADGFSASSDLARTRTGLYHHFGVEVANPVTYPTGDYVFFRWPHPAQIRHFTRISCIKQGKSKVIAHLGSSPVAVRQEIGLGAVVILGSALGSHLLAGDEQAGQIFASLVVRDGSSNG
jgi:hypothetical protein